MSSFSIFHKTRKQKKGLTDFLGKRSAFSQSHMFLTVPGMELLLWSALRKETSCFYSINEGGFAGLAGTFFFGGAEGEEALHRYYASFDPENISLSGTSGHFAMVIEKEGRLFVLNDRLGVWKLYKSADGSYVSAGFLDALLLADKPVFNTQGVYEYVFNGHPLGQNTFIKNFTAAMPGQGYELLANGQIKLIEHSDKVSPVAQYSKDISLEEIATDQTLSFRELLKSYGNVKGKDITSSLSGGFDSRLMLAGFLERDIVPDLFVYGNASDPDVISAQSVAAKAGLPIRHIDKGLIDLSQQNRPNVETLLYYFDGWTESGLLPADVDLHDRLNRSQAAPFMANGSGGEIYRHFFLYPDKEAPIDAFLAATYARYDKGIISGVFDSDAYQATIKDSFVSLMGLSGQNTLSRQDIDRVYINVRCSHEKARDIPINHRFVKVLYPFMEPEIVQNSLRLRYAHRQFGKTEAHMIALINPDLAAVPGEYGHSFVEEPSFSYKARVLQSYYRPFWLRALIPAVRRHLGQAVGVKALLGDALHVVEDTEFPCMQAYFEVDKVSDMNTASRIATLELLAQTFNISNE